MVARSSDAFRPRLLLRNPSQTLLAVALAYTGKFGKYSLHSSHDYWSCSTALLSPFHPFNIILVFHISFSAIIESPPRIRN